MKKIIALLCSFGVLQTFDNAQQVIALMYHDEAMKGKVSQFFQSAIDTFIGDDRSVTLDVTSVINHFLERQASKISDISFGDNQLFENWVEKQQKTLLFLYEPSDIACSVVYQYLVELKEMSSSTVNLVQTTMSNFNEQVLKKQLNSQEAWELVDAVPTVILVEDGLVKYLSLQGLLTVLKFEIDRFYNG